MRARLILASLGHRVGTSVAESKRRIEVDGSYLLECALRADFSLSCVRR